MTRARGDGLYSAIDRYFFTIILFVLLWRKKNANSTCNKYLFSLFFSRSLALAPSLTLVLIHRHRYHFSTIVCNSYHFFPVFFSPLRRKLYPVSHFSMGHFTFGISLWHLNIANIFWLLIFFLLCLAVSTRTIFVME